MISFSYRLYKHTIIIKQNFLDASFGNASVNGWYFERLCVGGSHKMRQEISFSIFEMNTTKQAHMHAHIDLTTAIQNEAEL